MKKRMLHIEDDPSQRTLIRDLFTRVGYTVKDVDNGAAGLKELKKTAFEAILIDLHVPGISGQELIGRILQNRTGLRSKILVLSGVVSKGEREYFQKNEIRFLSKPYHLRELLSIVESFSV
jgi:CheY-like chemotaxis protein